MDLSLSFYLQEWPLTPHAREQANELFMRGSVMVYTIITSPLHNVSYSLNKM